MKRFLLFIGFVFLGFSGFAQNETKILLEASPSLSMHNYTIGIIVNSKTIEINYEIADSIDRRKLKTILYRDNMLSKSITLIGNELTIQDSISLYHKKLDSSIKESTIYSRNKIVVNKRKARYFELLTAIFNSSEKELTKNGDRGILDGTHFNIILLKNGIERKFNAHSPDINSQPLFAKLIEQTISFLPEKEQKKYSR